ncbi:hypothetical protein AVEN_106354-1 [Araneus ventricosus]|uniref:Uncharacterized protein n=1 Tax=Araneus ventricosus TaxID=182803 RepID=A0A4Y2ASY2_ARAVE|nr:hypothetical protein AVEN_106354-1 [Araneus ventricosus]
MAMQESILISQGNTSEINSLLLPFFLTRTREAIKGQRRQKKYKDRVEEYCQRNLKPSLPDLTAGPGPPTASLANNRIPPSAASSAIVPVTQVPIPESYRITRNDTDPDDHLPDDPGVMYSSDIDPSTNQPNSQRHS